VGAKLAFQLLQGPLLATRAGAIGPNFPQLHISTQHVERATRLLLTDKDKT
jgi:hypothetical protein